MMQTTVNNHSSRDNLLQKTAYISQQLQSIKQNKSLPILQRGAQNMSRMRTKEGNSRGHGMSLTIFGQQNSRRSHGRNPGSGSIMVPAIFSNT